MYWTQSTSLDELQRLRVDVAANCNDRPWDVTEASTLKLLDARIKELRSAPAPVPQPATTDRPGTDKPDPMRKSVRWNSLQKVLEGVADLMKAYTDRRVAKLEERLQTLEERPMRYLGVYENGKAYFKNSVCTHGGSMWIALSDTIQPPGETDAWQLCVKRGRDGKSAG